MGRRLQVSESVIPNLDERYATTDNTEEPEIVLVSVDGMINVQHNVYTFLQLIFLQFYMDTANSKFSEFRFYFSIQLFRIFEKFFPETKQP